MAGGDEVVYVSTIRAAKMLRCSSPTIRRIAKAQGVGVRVEGGRLVALTQTDIAAIKPHVHETSGNPLWIAAARKKVPASRR
jgi:hypothetical protein